jgi:hypothetical protein
LASNFIGSDEAIRSDTVLDTYKRPSSIRFRADGGNVIAAFARKAGIPPRILPARQAPDLHIDNSRHESEDLSLNG